MKLKAIKGSFWVRNNVRDIMVSISEGDVFDFLDIDVDHQDISLLLADGRVTVVDDAYVPERAHYRVLRPFTIFISGERVEKKAGEMIELGQCEACKMMGDLKVRPLNPEAWYPFKEFQVSKKITKMYDKEMGDGNS